MVASRQALADMGLDDRGLALADRHRIAVLHHAVDGRDALDFCRRDDGAAGRRLDRRVAAGVIGVPVCVPNLGNLPALRGGFAHIRLAIGRIDADRLLAHRIVDEEAVVVGQAGELMDL